MQTCVCICIHGSVDFLVPSGLVRDTNGKTIIFGAQNWNSCSSDGRTPGKTGISHHTGQDFVHPHNG